jgi:hypothetical protein
VPTRWEDRIQRLAERQQKRTTISKARKGFPIKLNEAWALSIQQIYAWMKAKGKNTPGTDEVIKLIPDIDPKIDKHTRGYEYVNKGRACTIRVRGDQIQAMIELFEACVNYGTCTWALHNRIRDLKKIAPMDAMADAAR